MRHDGIVFIVFMVILLIGKAHANEIYTWTDSNGVVHFSDHPGPHAKPVKIQETQTFSTQTASQIAPSPQMVKETPPVEPSYSIVKILEPSNQLTIRNPQGYVPVMVEIKPNLQEGDGIQLVLDGKTVGNPQQARSFSLQGIERGAHELLAQVVNEKGKVLISSEPVTIYMMPPRVNMGR